MTTTENADHRHTADLGGSSAEHPALRVRDLSKRFGPVAALTNVSLEVAAGSVHAVLGGNGSGKSTLIKVLAGVHSADTGVVEVGGERIDGSATNPGWAHEAGLRFVHQQIGAFDTMTVAENFALVSGFAEAGFAPIRRTRLDRRVAEVLERFDVRARPTDVMGDLSQATRTMVAVARALATHTGERGGLLVLDEPTASLPPAEVDLLLDAVRAWRARGQSVILVTHRLREVLDVADAATFLRDGAVLESGPVSAFDERAMVQRIAGIERAPRERERPIGDTVRLRVRDLSVAGLRRVDFDVHAGEILGIAGMVGSGRSRLLRALFGSERLRAGTFELDGAPYRPTGTPAAVAAGLAFVPEDRHRDAAFLEQPIRTNLVAADIRRHWNGWRIDARREHTAAVAAVQEYGVVAASVDDPLGSLSGGNQQKVILARWMSTGPKVLLLDEPTQGVDVGARTAIHNLIKTAADAGMSVVVASSDLRELAELCDRVVGLVDGHIRGELTGELVTPDRCLGLAHALSHEETPDEH